jgi:hypothetical protein
MERAGLVPALFFWPGAIWFPHHKQGVENVPNSRRSRILDIKPGLKTVQGRPMGHRLRFRLHPPQPATALALSGTDFAREMQQAPLIRSLSSFTLRGVLFPLEVVV